MGVFENWNNNGSEGMETTMNKNITNLDRVTPTKRQMDEMNMMLDESISPKADWDDPSDVLAWMEESEENLNDPSFASLIYKDGKTPGEVMLDMLKEHGYGNDFLNESETGQKISKKMAALENQLLLDKMVTLESEIYGPADSPNPTQTFDASVSSTPESTHLGNEERDDAFYNQFLDPTLDGNGQAWEDERSVEINTPQKESFGTTGPQQPLDSAFFETDTTQIENEIQEGNDSIPSWLYSEESSLPSDDYIDQRDDQMRQPFFTVQPKMEEAVVEDTSAFEREPEQPSFFTEQTEEERVEDITRQPFFTVQPKTEQAVVENTSAFEREPEQPSILREQTEEERVEDITRQSFFTRQPKAETAMPETARVEEQFNVPSNNIQENLAAINYAIATREPKDLARAEQALAALPQEDETTKHFKQELDQIKEESRQVANPTPRNSVEELLAFQEKYGPTANEHEMQIVNQLEEKITLLETRRQEIVDRLNVIKEELKDKKINKKQVPVTAQVTNRIDTTQIEQALQEVHEMEKNSTRKLRNNEAMPDFYKAVETHQIMDIVRASNAVESLGTSHLFYGSLNSALNEVANTYYGKTIEGLKVELRETSKEFREALDLLELDNNQVLAGRIGPLKEAFNQIATDRSKERMLTAIDEVQKLGANHPYAKRLTKALNGMSSIYYGKTAEELQRQIAECNKATTAVHEKIEKDKKSTQLLYDDDSKGKEYDIVEALYNQAVLNPTKENILNTVEVTRGLAQNRESTIALNSALDKLTSTYLDTSLNELKKKDLTQSIENIQKAYAQIPETAPIEDALEDAIIAFNKATQTKEKGDIIVAANMAVKIVENKELAENMINTLDKLALVHYGVDATEITEQFKKYSGALNEVNDMVAPNSKKISEDAKQNDAMPYFYKAIQTRDIEDIKTAIDEVNKLPEYHPLKKPLLNALNAEKDLVERKTNSYILEENENIFEGNNDIIEEEVSESELKQEATDLINECKDIDEQLNKYNQSLNKYKENKKKEAKDLETKDLEPPAEVISDATNKNPGLFKKAAAGMKEALSKIKITKKGVASVIVDASLIGLSIVTAQGAIPLVAYLGYKYSKKYKEMKSAKKEKQQEIKNQVEKKPKEDDMTAAIIENGLQAINERDIANKKAIQYYKLAGKTPEGTDNWQLLGNAIDGRVGVIDALVEGIPVGYTRLGVQDSTLTTIPQRNLEEFLERNDNQLPSAEEISSVVRTETMSDIMQEGMRRGR